MTEREEFVKSITDPIYTIQEQRWNNDNYPYWDTVSFWETPEQAHENLPKIQGNHKRRIIKQRLMATQIGRIMWTNDFVVFDENGNWHPHYDPRTSDPEWKTYLRLKEKFDA